MALNDARSKLPAGPAAEPQPAQEVEITGPLAGSTAGPGDGVTLSTAFGWVLTAAALTYAGIGVWQLATDGDCAQQDAAGACSERHNRTGAVPFILAGTTALGATAMFVFTPLEFD